MMAAWKVLQKAPTKAALRVGLLAARWVVLRAARKASWLAVSTAGKTAVWRAFRWAY